MQGAGSGLQRSVTSYRRRGSSGLVWNDNFLQQQPEDQEDRRKVRNVLSNHELNTTHCKDQAAVIVTRSQSAGPSISYHRRTKTAMEVKAALPPGSADPPSPKFSSCGLICGLFGIRRLARS